MPKSLIILLLALLLHGVAWPQEGESGSEVAPSGNETDAPAATAAAQTEEAEEIEEADEIDDSDLDEQTYEEDEDDFIPSEEIPADQPIPFPSNI